MAFIYVNTFCKLYKIACFRNKQPILETEWSEFLINVQTDRTGKENKALPHMNNAG